MTSNGPAVAVFGGSRATRGSSDYQDAYRVGALLAAHGMTVVNGGYAGLMEASARGAREAGGRVLAVTSPIFIESKLNDYVDEEVPTDDLYARIRELVVRGDGYLVLKGSHGTLAELSIVWNLAGIDPGFQKPIVLLGGFWRPVLQAFQDQLAVTPELVALLHVADTPEEAVAFLETRLKG